MSEIIYKDTVLSLPALQVAVSPIEHTVAEGVNVTFECFVDGNVIDSVHWRRDFEELDKNKVRTYNYVVSLHACPYMTYPVYVLYGS